MLEIWTVYHFVGYDLQINLAHELLVYYVCGKLDSLYKFSIDIFTVVLYMVKFSGASQKICFILQFSPNIDDCFTFSFRQNDSQLQGFLLKQVCATLALKT